MKIKTKQIKIKVRVTPELLAKADKLSPNRKLAQYVEGSTCPIALGIAEQIGLKAHVDEDEICVGGINGNDTAVFITSAKAARFIDMWDDGMPVKPQSFTFTLSQFDCNDD